ncbi:MAG TPA: TfoX/Sxy family protein [Acidimicrobiales bacterium]|jgi:TfoX/Sxy family transcriptional regulator of competence genes|nr:TfoX/Sxy family protein [Acidimicrobiales bacterium]
MSPVDIDERLAALVEEFAGCAGVAVPGETGRRGFGSDALTVNGSIFAMVSRGRLVVKLPARRVAALIESGTGTPFDAGKGRPMKEWLAVTSDDDTTWRTLGREALEFVASRPRRR